MYSTAPWNLELLVSVYVVCVCVCVRVCVCVCVEDPILNKLDRESDRSFFPDSEIQLEHAKHLLLIECRCTRI